MAVPPEMDADQRRVVDHRAGPLLVLAVRAPARRPHGRGGRPRMRAPGGPRECSAACAGADLLPRAAADLRLRSAGRWQVDNNPHGDDLSAYCSHYCAVCRPDAEGHGLRLLTAPEQEFRVRETLAGRTPNGIPGPIHTPGSRHPASPARSGQCWPSASARSRSGGPGRGVRPGRASGVGGRGRFMAEYLDVLDRGSPGYPELCTVPHPAHDPQILGLLRSETDGIYLDEFQDTDPAQARAGGPTRRLGGTVVPSATRTSRLCLRRGPRPRASSTIPISSDLVREPAPSLPWAPRRFGTRFARHPARRRPVPLHRPLRPRCGKRSGTGGAVGGPARTSRGAHL